MARALKPGLTRWHVYNYGGPYIFYYGTDISDNPAVKVCFDKIDTNIISKAIGVFSIALFLERQGYERYALHVHYLCRYGKISERFI